MRVLVLTPFGKTEPNAEGNLARVARPDTELSVQCIDDVFPLPYNTYRYNTMKCTDGALERIIKAEAEGFDAVVVSCTFDPGVFEARGVVDIPVLGILESSLLLSMMMGQMYSIVAPERVAASTLRRLVRTYGLEARCASIRHLDTVARDLYPEVTPVSQVMERLVNVSRACLEDGAEVIVPGCSIIGAIFTQSFGDDPAQSIGLPVIDPMIVAFKMAEMMVDLHMMAGYPAVSRAGLWRKQPAQEYNELRQWMLARPAPLQAYRP